METTLAEHLIDNTETPPNKKMPWWLDFASSIIIITIVLILLRSFVFLPFSIDGESMESTLHHGELIYVDRLVPSIWGYERGDIVVFKPPTDKKNPEQGIMCALLKVKNTVLFQNNPNPCLVDASYVKRVIGIPGDNVEIRNGHVYITPPNGEKTMVSEEFLMDSNKQNTCFPLEGCGRFKLKSEAGKDFGIVPEDSYFVLGDNRMNSSDSRVSNWDSHFVPEENITGTVRAVYLSPKSRPYTDNKLDWTLEFLKSLPESFVGIRWIGSTQLLY